MIRESIRTVLLSVSLATLAVGLVGCDNQGTSGGTGPTGPSSLQPSLTEHQWLLILMEGQPTLPDVKVTALFTDGRVAGSAGCNRYFGTADVSGAQIAISPLASTMMFCGADGVMVQENRYLQTLRGAVSFTIVNGRLVIATAQSPSALIFADQ